MNDTQVRYSPDKFYPVCESDENGDAIYTGEIVRVRQTGPDFDNDWEEVSRQTCATAEAALQICEAANYALKVGFGFTDHE